jgi:hypothetical protein
MNEIIVYQKNDQLNVTWNPGENFETATSNTQTVKVKNFVFVGGGNRMGDYREILAMI